MNEYDWDNCPKKIIKLRMIQLDIKLKELTALLVEKGLQETEKSVSLKLSRGKFSAIFFVQCLHVMGVNKLSLEDEVIMKQHTKK